MPKHYHVIYGILISSAIIISWIREAYSGHSEKRLLKYLFDQKRWDAHNPMERPVSIDGKPVQVFLKCFLNQIMDMDEKNQILSTIMWLDIKWTDYHFQWNLSDYENIRQINLPQERMWKPDILLYNSASEKFDQMFPTKVTVRNNGQIQWVPPGLFHSICDIEVNWFPFDSQNCILKFGTWTYQGNKVDLKLQCDNETGEDKPCHYANEVDLSTYLANSEWALEKGLVKRNIQTYGSDDQTYIDVTINVYMQRRALYYVFNIIIPCMIMSVMALLVFTLPPEANEKIVLGVTTLLSLTMLLQLVGDKLPQTSSGNPVLVLYFTCTMILCSLSLVCAVVLLNCHHHTGGIVYVPWWVETLINTWLASLLRIDHNSPEENLYAPKEKLLPKHRVNSNLTDCNENTSLYNKSSIGRIKPNKASRESKTLTNDSRDESLNSPTKNTPVWSNVIDVNSEFRPAVLIHRTVAPQLNSPQHTGVVVKQNHFIEPLQQQQVKLRNLSTRQLNRFFSQEEEDDEEEAAAAAGGMRSGVSSRLEYACNRSASMKYGYSNKENIRMSIPANTTNAINGQLIKSTKYLDKTLPRSHIPSACASMTSSASASASPSSPSSSSSLTESRINPSPEKLKQWSDTLLFSSPSKTDDLSFSSPLKQDSYQTRDNQIIASSDTDDLLLLKLKQISKELRFITSGMHIRDQEVKTSNQWRLACRVLDRFCLLVFAALNLFTTLGILTSAPTVIKAFTFKGEPSRPM